MTSFTLIESTTIRLWDYGWFDLSRFEVLEPGLGADRGEEVLRRFLSVPESQRSFCDPGPWGEPTGRHGPYVHGASLAAYLHSLPRQAFEVRVRSALAGGDSLAALKSEESRPVEAWAAAVLARGDELFALDVPAKAEVRVDWAWVWLLWEELFALSPDGRELCVAVLGYD